MIRFETKKNFQNPLHGYGRVTHWYYNLVDGILRIKMIICIGWNIIKNCEE